LRDLAQQSNVRGLEEHAKQEFECAIYMLQNELHLRKFVVGKCSENKYRGTWSPTPDDTNSAQRRALDVLVLPCCLASEKYLSQHSLHYPNAFLSVPATPHTFLFFSKN
jgi:hypothetical protein